MIYPNTEAPLSRPSSGTALRSVMCLIVVLGVMASARSAESPQETVLFVRNGDIWSMDDSGGNQRHLTTSGVGHFSASTTGMIAYDRFRPFGPPIPLSDLNVYKSVIGESSATKLTNDNQSIQPSVSPDGSKIAFQKFEWKGEGNYLGRGRGIWIFDTKTGDQKELVGIVPLSVAITKKRNKIRLVGANSMNDAKWIYDSDIIWSADSRSLLFQRTYEKGGIVSFFIDLTKTDKPQAVPEPLDPCGMDLRGSRILCFDNAAFSLITYDFATNRTDVLRKGVFVSAARFSPDGTRIAFAVTTGNDANLSDIYVISSSGQNMKKLTDHSMHQIQDLTWSLDGKRILVETYLSGVTPEAGRSEIWSMAVDGTNLKRLADRARLPRPTSSHEPATSRPTLAWDDTALNQKEKIVIQYIATNVLPNLSGTKKQKIEDAAAATWWSLNESIARLDNPYVFSNCYPDERKLQPLEVCKPAPNGKFIWQVGLAGIQVPDYSDSAVAAEIAKLYPGQSESYLLEYAGRLAGFGDDAQVLSGIVNSKGLLRRSWLLRHPVIGMSLIAGAVRDQCFVVNPKSWCTPNTSVTYEQLKTVFAQAL